MEFCNGKIDYMNLNELELSHTNQEEMTKKGYKTKDPLSHGANNSEGTAMELLDFAKEQADYHVHYCSSKTKDLQMGKRIVKRAKSVKLPGDIETDEGTLIRGVIYFKELVPGEKYTKIINGLSKEKKEDYLRQLKKIKKELAQKHGKDYFLRNEREIKGSMEPRKG